MKGFSNIISTLLYTLNKNIWEIYLYLFVIAVFSVLHLRNFRIAIFSIAHRRSNNVISFIRLSLKYTFIF